MELDLDRDGPHALIAGTTGSGKSELLRSLVVALATCHPPTAVTFLLVDYKGGAAFGECARLPHVTGLVTDLDAHLTRRALRSLRAELQRRERLLAEAGAPDLHAYRSAPGRQPLPRLVVVVDEFATLVAELPEFVSGLIEVAQRGRSLGLHLILATQRPAGAVSAEIRANAALRIALRTLSAADSLDILDSPAAAALPSDLPGRAVWAAPTPVTFQVGVLAAAPEPEQITITELGMWRRLPQSVSTPAAPTSDALVAAITEAGGDAASPSAIWVDPLPEHVARRDLPAGVGALGLVDLPDEQRRDTLRLSPGMLIAGGPRSGRSTALAGVALAAAESGRAAIYVLDFAGDALRILAALPQVGSLLTPEDGIAPIEALTTRLSSCWAERRRGPEPDSAVLLLIDGWEQLCAALDAADPIGGASRVMALLRDAPAARASVVIAGDRSVLAPRLSALATERIVLPLADPEGYEQLGLRRTAIPSSAAPGRGIRLRDGAELQLAHPGREPGWPATAGAVRALAARPRPAGPSLIRVRALPRRLTTPPAEAADGRMFLGIGGDEATPLWLSTGPGARVLVAGPSRSGRSSALHLILEAFGASSPLVVAPPGSPLIAAARGTGAPVADPRRGLESHPDLVLVDDAADLVDTPLGHELAALTDEAEISVVASLCTDRLLTLRGLPAALARSGLTILLQPSPGDAQLLGRAVPRHLLGGPPGRGVAFGAALVAPEHGPLPLQLRLAQWSAA
ncbi:FtsK/SpoIIIE domain-containing protein [Jatrophihabitans sp.]|uniref:FtsK/SpoIIIE domain-containing protein n=1 Tax=Jatrophihabitans sp. TaxID=1932789 RepID=UPI0030C70A50|nr:segregation ATPase FtsK/SpoIIIE, family [Jatrophihabitans sp.]